MNYKNPGNTIIHEITPMGNNKIDTYLNKKEDIDSLKVTVSESINK